MNVAPTMNSHYLRQSIQSFQNGVDEPTKVFDHLKKYLTKNYSYQFEGRLTEKEFKKEIKSYLVNVSIEIEFHSKFGLGTPYQDYIQMSENDVVADFKRHLKSTKNKQRCK